MPDVSIVVRKDGSVVDEDAEDGDDTDVDAISGSGETEFDPTTPDPVPYLTPTSDKTGQKVGTPKEEELLPYIISAVAGLVIVILVILFIVYCVRKRRRRRKSPYEKSNSGPVVYNPNGCAEAGGEGYSVAIPLTLGEPPLEDAPPPPVPASAPPMPPGLSASGGSMTPRYTPLGGRKGVSTAPMPSDSEKNSIYESIDDNQVDNVYEEAKPAIPKSSSGRKPRPLSSVGEDMGMGSEKDKMLAPSSPV